MALFFLLWGKPSRSVLCSIWYKIDDLSALIGLYKQRPGTRKLPVSTTSVQTDIVRPLY